ncbi:MAG: glycerophosphodiester phosphodiesterase family protein [Thiotrichales bacterium]
MPTVIHRIVLGLTVVSTVALASAAAAAEWHRPHWGGHAHERIEVGVRPHFLVDQMGDSALKARLEQCVDMPVRRTDFSIGHRGAALQFPEHTRESYIAGARQGAGILECDVTFTKDRELVCRHSQCDLHTTTNILATPLAAKCSKPFSPAEFDAEGKLVKPASAECCASDITLAEFKSLCGKMDASNPRAKTVAEYLGGTPAWRTDLYASCGTVLTHEESIELFQSLGVKMTPELKSPSVAMPFDGNYTQQAYAQQMIDEYKAAGVPPWKVFPQSFNKADVLYWIASEPAFGRQAVFLDDANDVSELPNADELKQYAEAGIRIVAPPLWALLALDANKQIVPSQYANAAKAAGLDLITWTIERSPPANAPSGLGWYYQTTEGAHDNDGDYLMRTLDVLAHDVGIRGIFSDWPATVSYYANCMGLR